MVYVGSNDGKLYAFDAAGNTNCSGSPITCAPLWTADTGAEVFSSPVVANGVVYVSSVSEDNNLHAFDAAGNTNCSGSPKVCTPLWTADASILSGQGIFSSPAVANGMLYVGSNDHNLYAFDAAGNANCSGSAMTCEPLWTADTAGSVQSSPAVANGVVYVGSNPSNLYAFDAAGNTNCSGTPKTCTALWTSINLGDSGVVSSPAVANGVVYVGSNDHKLYAFDAAGSTNCSGSPTTCSPLWAGVTDGAVQSSPAVAYGIVYVGSDDSKLHAFRLP
jgi:outer membrane protein assembly factor BamB